MPVSLYVTLSRSFTSGAGMAIAFEDVSTIGDVDWRIFFVPTEEERKEGEEEEQKTVFVIRFLAEDEVEEDDRKESAPRRTAAGDESEVVIIALDFFCDAFLLFRF